MPETTINPSSQTIQTNTTMNPRDSGQSSINSISQTIMSQQMQRQVFKQNDRRDMQIARSNNLAYEAQRKRIYDAYQEAKAEEEQFRKRAIEREQSLDEKHWLNMGTEFIYASPRQFGARAAGDPGQYNTANEGNLYTIGNVSDLSESYQQLSGLYNHLNELSDREQQEIKTFDSFNFAKGGGNIWANERSRALYKASQASQGNTLYSAAVEADVRRQYANATTAEEKARLYEQLQTHTISGASGNANNYLVQSGNTTKVVSVNPSSLSWSDQYRLYDTYMRADPGSRNESAAKSALIASGSNILSQDFNQRMNASANSRLQGQYDIWQNNYDALRSQWVDNAYTNSGYSDAARIRLSALTEARPSVMAEKKQIEQSAINVYSDRTSGYSDISNRYNSPEYHLEQLQNMYSGNKIPSIVPLPDSNERDLSPNAFMSEASALYGLTGSDNWAPGNFDLLNSENPDENPFTSYGSFKGFDSAGGRLRSRQYILTTDDSKRQYLLLNYEDENQDEDRWQIYDLKGDIVASSSTTDNQDLKRVLDRLNVPYNTEYDESPLSILSAVPVNLGANTLEDVFYRDMIPDESAVAYAKASSLNLFASPQELKQITKDTINSFRIDVPENNTTDIQDSVTVSSITPIPKENWIDVSPEKFMQEKIITDARFGNAWTGGADTINPIAYAEQLRNYGAFMGIPESDIVNQYALVDSSGLKRYIAVQDKSGGSQVYSWAGQITGSSSQDSGIEGLQDVLKRLDIPRNEESSNPFEGVEFEVLRDVQSPIGDTAAGFKSSFLNVFVTNEALENYTRNISNFQIESSNTNSSDSSDMFRQMSLPVISSAAAAVPIFGMRPILRESASVDVWKNLQSAPDRIKDDVAYAADNLYSAAKDTRNIQRDWNNFVNPYLDMIYDWNDPTQKTEIDVINNLISDPTYTNIDNFIPDITVAIGRPLTRQVAEGYTTLFGGALALPAYYVEASDWYYDTRNKDNLTFSDSDSIASLLIVPEAYKESPEKPYVVAGVKSLGTLPISAGVGYFATKNLYSGIVEENNPRKLGYDIAALALTAGASKAGSKILGKSSIFDEPLISDQFLEKVKTTVVNSGKGVLKRFDRDDFTSNTNEISQFTPEETAILSDMRIQDIRDLYKYYHPESQMNRVTPKYLLPEQMADELHYAYHEFAQLDEWTPEALQKYHTYIDKYDNIMDPYRDVILTRNDFDGTIAAAERAQKSVIPQSQPQKNKIYDSERITSKSPEIQNDLIASPIDFDVTPLGPMYIRETDQFSSIPHRFAPKTIRNPDAFEEDLFETSIDSMTARRLRALGKEDEIPPIKFATKIDSDVDIMNYFEDSLTSSGFEIIPDTTEFQKLRKKYYQGLNDVRIISTPNRFAPKTIRNPDAFEEDLFKTSIDSMTARRFRALGKEDEIPPIKFATKIDSDVDIMNYFEDSLTSSGFEIIPDTTEFQKLRKKYYQGLNDVRIISTPNRFAPRTIRNPDAFEEDLFKTSIDSIKARRLRALGREDEISPVKFATKALNYDGYELSRILTDIPADASKKSIISLPKNSPVQIYSPKKTTNLPKKLIDTPKITRRANAAPIKRPDVIKRYIPNTTDISKGFTNKVDSFKGNDNPINVLKSSNSDTSPNNSNFDTYTSISSGSLILKTKIDVPASNSMRPLQTTPKINPTSRNTLSMRPLQTTSPSQTEFKIPKKYSQNYLKYIKTQKPMNNKKMKVKKESQVTNLYLSMINTQNSESVSEKYSENNLNKQDADITPSTNLMRLPKQKQKQSQTQDEEQRLDLLKLFRMRSHEIETKKRTKKTPPPKKPIRKPKKERLPQKKKNSKKRFGGNSKKQSIIPKINTSKYTSENVELPILSGFEAYSGIYSPIIKPTKKEYFIKIGDSKYTKTTKRKYNKIRR